MGIVLLICAAGCESDVNASTPEVAARVAEVVYGEDGRLDVYEASDVFARRATESSVALMSYGFLRSTPEGIAINGALLGAAEELCEDQRFRDQSVAASCSGTLVGDDLVLTAGHCLSSVEACSALAIVFNYRMSDATTPHTLTDDDIYSCVEIVARSLPDSSSLDFAFLRLDRPVAPHLRPAPARLPGGLLPRGTSLTMIGHPSGLPAKITTGGVVQDESLRSGNLFLTNLDAFAGNSGSGVYDERGLLAGVLVWGERDYRDRAGASCREVNQLSEGAGSEGVVYAFRAIERLCVDSPFVSSVCEAFCEDGVCNEQAPPSGPCGQEPCGPPPGWVCAPEAFGAGGTCDCECGAVDPDCGLPSRLVLGCQDGMICGEEARCVEAPAKSRHGIFRGCQAAHDGGGALVLTLMLGALLWAGRRGRRARHDEM